MKQGPGKKDPLHRSFFSYWPLAGAALGQWLPSKPRPESVDFTIYILYIHFNINCIACTARHGQIVYCWPMPLGHDIDCEAWPDCVYRCWHSIITHQQGMQLPMLGLVAILWLYSYNQTLIPCRQCIRCWKVIWNIDVYFCFDWRSTCAGKILFSHFVMKHHQYKVGTRKKDPLCGSFFLASPCLVLLLGQWLPSKPWLERSTFLYSIHWDTHLLQVLLGGSS